MSLKAKIDALLLEIRLQHRECGRILINEEQSKELIKELRELYTPSIPEEITTIASYQGIPVKILPLEKSLPPEEMHAIVCIDQTCTIMGIVSRGFKK